MLIATYIYWGSQIVLMLLLYYFSFKVLLVIYTMTPLYKGKVPYVPTRIKFLKKGFEMLNINEGDNVVDIGSGDGRFVIYGARRVKAKFTGIEINVILWLSSLVKEFFVRKKGDIVWVHDNYMNVALSEFNKVFLFSTPRQIKILLSKLRKELKPGTLLLSETFPLKVSSFRLVEEFCHKNHKLYLYERVG